MKNILYLSGLILLSSTVFGMQQEIPMDQDDQKDPVAQRLVRSLRPEDRVVKCCVCGQKIETISPDTLNQLRSLPEIKEYLRSLGLEDCDSCAVVFHAECLKKAKEDPNFSLALCPHPELFKWRSFWRAKRYFQEKILSNTMRYGIELIQYNRMHSDWAKNLLGTLAFISLGEIILGVAFEIGDETKGRRGYAKKWEIMAAAMLMYCALQMPTPWW